MAPGAGDAPVAAVPCGRGDRTSIAANAHAVCDHTGGHTLDREAILDVECDVWIPAARPDVGREDNVHRLKTKLVRPGANIAFTVGAERTLHDRGVLVVPDFIANAGGVIGAAMEYRGATQAVCELHL